MRLLQKMIHLVLLHNLYPLMERFVPNVSVNEAQGD